MKLGKVLENIHVFVPNSMMNNIKYTITVQEDTDVLIKQTGEAQTK